MKYTLFKIYDNFRQGITIYRIKINIKLKGSKIMEFLGYNYKIIIIYLFYIIIVYHIKYYHKTNNNYF